MSLVTGARVMVWFADAGWCSGAIEAKKKDGKYAIAFDDGDRDNIPPSEVRLEDEGTRWRWPTGYVAGHGLFHPGQSNAEPEPEQPRKDAIRLRPQSLAGGMSFLPPTDRYIYY